MAMAQATGETVRAPAAPAVADPAPLGLAAFALTTFLLSAKNAGWTHGGDAWLGYALAYGGFWIGLGLYVLFAAAKSTNVANDLGWILLAFAIFNTYMMLWSARINTAVFSVFLTLEATEVILFIGNFSNKSGIVKLGGWVGILTALVAWYASASGVVNGMAAREVLPVGSPMWK